MMTLHSKPDPTMITNHFCACGLFSQWNIRQNYFVFVEFWTTFFRVSTCFNGSAAAMDAQLGFGTRLRWFCDRGVWWKRTFCGKFGSGNYVDWLLLLLDWVFRCQQWFEWRSQRFCCDVPDSNDSSTSRRRLIYVNLCFHLYFHLIKNRMPVIPFASERVFNSATFMPMLIPLKTLRNVSNLHLKIYSG